MSSDMPNKTTDTHWDDLYKRGLGAPKYPNSYTVRWLFGQFPRSQSADYHLLDIGCGMGRHAMLMAREGYQVSASDVSETCIEQATGWAVAEDQNITFTQASADKQPFADQSFDGIISYGVLYYLTPDQFNMAVAEIYRLLKPGGHAFVMVKNDRDIRKLMSEKIAPHHYKITKVKEGMPWNNELGMGLTLLPKSEVLAYFADFSEVTIEEVTSTLGDGTYQEAAWLIYVTR